MQQPCPTACGLLLSCATTQEMLCWKLQPCTFAVALTPSPHRCLLPAVNEWLACWLACCWTQPCTHALSKPIIVLVWLHCSYSFGHEHANLARSLMALILPGHWVSACARLDPAVCASIGSMQYSSANTHCVNITPLNRRICHCRPSQ